MPLCYFILFTLPILSIATARYLCAVTDAAAVSYRRRPDGNIRLKEK